jgi:predicted AAA+ superfamily ATPase
MPKKKIFRKLRISGAPFPRNFRGKTGNFSTNLSKPAPVRVNMIYLSDAGLLRRLAKLPPAVIVNNSPLYIEFKGAMTENIVLQSLVSQFEVMPRYWTSQRNAEVDFLLQDGLDIIPVEVKSAHNVAGKSLALYNELYNPVLRIRYSFNNLRKDGNLLNIPVFLADWTKKLVRFE